MRYSGIYLPTTMTELQIYQRPHIARSKLSMFLESVQFVSLVKIELNSVEWKSREMNCGRVPSLGVQNESTSREDPCDFILHYVRKPVFSQDNQIYRVSNVIIRLI